MSPRFLAPLEGLWVGLCHTLILTGGCLWDQGLGAYLLLSVFISPLSVDPTTQAPLSWEGLVTPPAARQKGKQENSSSSRRATTDRAERLVASASSKQTSL